MKRVHIVGGGISGCLLSFFLKNHFHVTLYEKQSQLGGLCRTFYTIENLPYQKGLHAIKNPEPWMIELLSQFITMKEIDLKFGINPFVDFNSYDFPLHYENIQTIAWHWIETIKLELEQTKEEYTEDFLRDFLIRNYGYTIYNIFYENFYKKMYGVDASEILFMNDFKSEFGSLTYKKPDKYFFPVNEGWNNLFTELTKDIDVRLNSEIDISQIDTSDIVVCTVRPDKFLKDGNLSYSKASFDVDSTLYKKDYYDVILYPNHLPFISMSQFGRLFPKYEKNTIVKEFILSDGEDEVYVPLTRANLFSYNVLIEKYPSVIFAGRQGSYKNMSITDCMKQAASISAQLKMENPND